MTVDEVLRAARAKIRLKKNWCRFMYARNSKRKWLPPKSTGARQWCAEGAICAVGPTPELTEAARRRLNRFGDVVDINDRQGHAAVMRLFNAAISEEGKRGR